MVQVNDASSFLQYCKDNFGRLNKKDYELIVFHLLLQDEFKNCSDFHISYKMGITEARVKQLRYEESLIFKKNEAEYHKMLLDLLKNSSFKFTDSGQKIQFCVNNKMLRLYLNDKLNQIGSFADSSFNSNIVSVTARDLLFLLGIDKYNEQIDKIYKSLQDNNKALPTSPKETMTKLATAVLSDIAKHIAPKVTEWIKEQITN